MERCKEIQEINDAMDIHRNTRYKYRKFGASDSEPYWTFENLVQDTLKGGKGKLPRSSSDWQLYSGMDTGPVVREMTKTAKVVRDLIKKYRRNSEVYNYYIEA